MTNQSRPYLLPPDQSYCCLESLSWRLWCLRSFCLSSTLKYVSFFHLFLRILYLINSPTRLIYEPCLLLHSDLVAWLPYCTVYNCFFFCLLLRMCWATMKKTKEETYAPYFKLGFFPLLFLFILIWNGYLFQNIYLFKLCV